MSKGWSSSSSGIKAWEMSAVLPDGQRWLDFKFRLSAFMGVLWLFKLPRLGQCSLLRKNIHWELFLEHGPGCGVGWVSRACSPWGGPGAVHGSWLGVSQLFSCLTYCKGCTLRNTTAAWFASIISPCPPANRPCWGTSPCQRSSRGLLGVARPGEDSGAWGERSCASEHVRGCSSH